MIYPPVCVMIIQRRRRAAVLRRKVGTAMPIHESREMYLETIYILSHKTSKLRAVNIVDYMGFSKPSVSRAIGILRRGGYITVDENGFITLTASGRATAEHIYERHTVLTEMLLGLGVDKGTAANDACRMEHYISDKSFNAIKRHLTENGVTLPALPHDEVADENDGASAHESEPEHHGTVTTAKAKRARKAK